MQILCLLFKSRDKPRQSFREWLQRLLANLILYLNSISPRHFDDASATSAQVIDLNLAFDFIFDRSSSQKMDRLTFKDVNEVSVGSALAKIEGIFRMIGMTIGAD